MKTLTDRQQEILLIAQEECAEVIQAISKTLRFGPDSSWQGRSNLERLEEEVGDLVCMIDLMKSHGIIDEEFVRHASLAKQIKLQKWSNIMENSNV
jgi:NTP pyrophosphatase (non-canonical NTP hydrolase)